MAKSNLLKEAIADAKAVRETALANAKIALEEAFTPRIQSMLSAKLAEEEDMEEQAEEPVETNGDGMDAAAGSKVSEAEHGDEGMEEDMEGEEAVSEDMEEPVEETEDNMEEDMEEEPVAEDDDLELEAIIKELEEELSDSGLGDGENKMDQADDHTEDPGEGDLTEEEDMEEGEDKDKMEEEAKEDMDEDISLDEIINALREEEGEKVEEEEKEDVKEEAENDLEEAYNVIKFLKSKINEVNLLNAKLLFSNKLFRNHSLNENQKMKVIENFDRAQSLREVKLVFATLAESFVIGGKTRKTIKESYASKPSRSTAPSKKVISEGSDLSARWRKLANL
jgi:hypothetical protein